MLPFVGAQLEVTRHQRAASFTSATFSTFATLQIHLPFMPALAATGTQGKSKSGGKKQSTRM